MNRRARIHEHQQLRLGQRCRRRRRRRRGRRQQHIGRIRLDDARIVALRRFAVERGCVVAAVAGYLEVADQAVVEALQIADDDGELHAAEGMVGVDEAPVFKRCKGLVERREALSLQPQRSLCDGERPAHKHPQARLAVGCCRCDLRVGSIGSFPKGAKALWGALPEAQREFAEVRVLVLHHRIEVGIDGGLIARRGLPDDAAVIVAQRERAQRVALGVVDEESDLDMTRQQPAAYRRRGRVRVHLVVFGRVGCEPAPQQARRLRKPWLRIDDIRHGCGTGGREAVSDVEVLDLHRSLATKGIHDLEGEFHVARAQSTVEAVGCRCERCDLARRCND